MDYNKKTIVVEIAGRDSYVALIKYAKLNPGSFFLPTITSIPTEEQRYSDFADLFQKLTLYITELGSTLYSPILAHTKSWKRAFAIPVMNQFDYGFTSPCLVCHSIVHGVRVNLAQSLSGKIITGEKEWHGEFIKLNQNKEVFSIFDQFFKDFNIEFIRLDLKSEDMDLFEIFLKDHQVDYPNFITCSIVDKIKVSDYEELKKYKIQEYFEKEVAPNLSQLISYKKEVWDEL